MSPYPAVDDFRRLFLEIDPEILAHVTYEPLPSCSRFFLFAGNFVSP